MTSGDAPMMPRSFGARRTPATAMNAAAITPSAMPCTAASAAPAGFFSPMRRATIAVTPMDSPIAAVYTSVSIDSVSPTVRDGVRAQMRDPEHVHDREHRLHHHLEHHRHSEQDDGTADRPRRVVVMRATD